MPTPNGVNYLLQFLNVSSRCCPPSRVGTRSPLRGRLDIQSWLFDPIRLNCQKQESKVDIQSYVLLSFICPPDFLFSDYTYLISCRHTSFIKITWCKTYFVVPIYCEGIKTEGFEIFHVLQFAADAFLHERREVH